MKGKKIKGEKYIYLALGYEAAKRNKGTVLIGNDNGFVGGQNYFRRFSIQNYQGEIILNEKKNHKSFADMNRCFVIVESKDRLRVYEYLNESNENGSTHWVH